MTILEEIYSGNIVPAEKFVKKGGEYAELLNILAECSDKLAVKLDGTERTLWEKATQAERSIEAISDKESFIDGFCLGARIMLEIMSRDLANRTIL